MTADNDSDEGPFGLLPELGHPMLAAHEAQAKEGFDWMRVDHFRYVDVPGLRFFPSMGDVLAQKLRRGGYMRFLALPFVVFPLLGMIDMWGSTYSMFWQVVSIALLALLAAGALFVFWVLGPDKSAVVGPARYGLYVYPTHLIVWTVRDNGKDVRWIMKREQVLRFYRKSSGGGSNGSGPRLMIEYRSSRTGEVETMRPSMVAGSDRERAWLEQWRATGSITHA
jgi:hypothetical protein